MTEKLIAITEEKDMCVFAIQGSGRFFDIFL